MSKILKMPNPLCLAKKTLLQSDLLNTVTEWFIKNVFSYRLFLL